MVRGTIIFEGTNRYGNGLRHAAQNEKSVIRTANRLKRLSGATGYTIKWVQNNPKSRPL